MKEFETGFSWQDQGRRALRKSSKIVLLLSPSASVSPGIKEELNFNASLDSRKRSISVHCHPVMAKGTRSKLLKGSHIGIKSDVSESDFLLPFTADIMPNLGPCRLEN
jgi:hypothetical protein